MSPLDNFAIIFDISLSSKLSLGIAVPLAKAVGSLRYSVRLSWVQIPFLEDNSGE